MEYKYIRRLFFDKNRWFRAVKRRKRRGKKEEKKRKKRGKRKGILVLKHCKVKIFASGGASGGALRGRLRRASSIFSPGSKKSTLRLCSNPFEM
jgi:hypothetical protein